MSKYTKGPWIAASSKSSVVGLPVVAQSGRSIASVTFFDLGEPFKHHNEESYANARLIAAAPDLLEALKQCKHGAEYADELGDIIDAAIAKAEPNARKEAGL